LTVIEVEGLEKRFGKVRALKGVSFTARPGEVYGLLGPNGAGKTTALRILATLLKADRGRARVNGLDAVRDSERVRRSIGVVNGGMGLYDRLTGREILHYFGRLYGMSRARIEERIGELDGLLNLGETLPRRAGGFSTGMKQKIVVARAVLHDPPVIFFDEATSGLDVMARRAVLDFVRDYPGRERTVIYSTHVMSEVEELCDRAAIVFEGEKIAEGSVQELLATGRADHLEQAFFGIVERYRAAGDVAEVAA
jgi:sodium transport system ATP-binding protein